MLDKAITNPRGKKAKKEIRRTLQEKLTVTLSDYKTMIGEKKFESRIRKAARSLGADILRSMPKKPKKQKKIIVEEVKNS